MDKLKVAQELGQLGGKATVKKYGADYFSKLGKKGMASRWSKGHTKMIDPTVGLMECQVCGQRWQPLLGHRGRIGWGGWKCLNGCSDKEKNDKQD